jgi:GH25 family lysozyme M1 (1,4-beta-N-acetylmuramidase)
VKAAGISFALVKATEGTGFVDPTFDDNWQGMKEAGIVRGAYHFFHPGQDASKQAAFLARVLELEQNDLPPVLDLETDDGMDAAIAVNAVEQWLNQVERLLGRKPIIYTGSWFWNPIAERLGQAPAWIGDYPLWVMHYTTASQPFLPTGWSRWTIWQYTDQGKVDGINGGNPPLDMNRFNGSPQDLVDWLAGTPKEREPEPDKIPHVMNQAMINAFYYVFGQQYWDKIQSAGLTGLAIPSSNRNLPYSGSAIQDLPNLTDGEKQALKAALKGG